MDTRTCGRGLGTVGKIMWAALAWTGAGLGYVIWALWGAAMGESLHEVLVRGLRALTVFVLPGWGVWLIGQMAAVHRGRRRVPAIDGFAWLVFLLATAVTVFLLHGLGRR